MKNLLFTLIVLLFCSCDPVPKKPFMIISKDIATSYGVQSYGTVYVYTYVDSVGNTHRFFDTIIYKVGEVIP